MARELPERSEVKTEDTWNLADIFADKEEWEKAVACVTEKTAGLREFEGHVGDSGQSLKAVLDLTTDISKNLYLVYEYAQRLWDEDQANQEHHAMAARMETLIADVQEASSFIDPEIIEIDDERLESFYADTEGLELYREYIKETVRVKAHRLSAELEKVLAMTAQMRNTPGEVRQIFDNAELVFPEIEDENGEKVRVTHGRYIRFMESADRRVRREAYEAMYNTYKSFENTYAAVYNGQCVQQNFIAKMRKYDSTLEAAVDCNNVPSDVYRNLVASVHKNLDRLHRYVSLRKRIMGLDELHMYDVYTPIVPGIAKEYTYEQAKEISLEALKPLGEEYLERVRRAYAERWIDVYENRGKRSGAYSAGTYGTHPYMLLNFSGNLDSVFTLVHEMGHSMHTMYSCENQPFVYSDYVIFAAEVASTVNEVLLLKYLLKNTDDRSEKIYLLNHFLDMFKGTFFRQTQFAEFELRSNEIVENGGNLTAENLYELYKEINTKYYGPDMQEDDLIGYEWSRIPHFYYNYYVYQYATSFSAAVAVADDILKEGAPAVERYKRFLSGGCSKPPVELLAGIGVDMTTTEPFDKAAAVMGDVLDEIEKLL